MRPLREPPAVDRDLLEAKDEVVSSMIRSMKLGAAEDGAEPERDEDPGVGYVQADVDACGAILHSLLVELGRVSARGDREAVRGVVKRGIIELNALNARCNGNLIETGEREAIAELIQTAANRSGWKTDEDVTEEWREW